MERERQPHLKCCQEIQKLLLVKLLLRTAGVYVLLVIAFAVEKLWSFLMTITLFSWGPSPNLASTLSQFTRIN